MNNHQSPICFVAAGDGVAQKIEDVLLPEVSCKIHDQADAKAVAAIGENSVECAIFYITPDNFPQTQPFLERIKTLYAIPMIAIVKDVDLEIARTCGQIGISRILDVHQMRHLKRSVLESILRTPAAGVMQELGIIVDNYPVAVRKILRYIAEHYISLLSVSQLAEAVGFNECVLSRLFRKHELVGPKRMLMCFKLRHALLLMNKRGLSIKKIAESSGFTSEKRFIECFSNTFHQPPHRYLKMQRGIIAEGLLSLKDDTSYRHGLSVGN